MSTVVRALARVLRDRLSEIDQEIVRSQSEREAAWLWRVRTHVRQMLRALCGHGHEQAK